MKKDFPIVRLSHMAEESLLTEEHHDRTQIYMRTLTEPRSATLHQHLQFFWELKGVKIPVPDGTRLRRYGVGEVGEAKSSDETAFVGPCYLYKLYNATILPRMNVVLYRDSVVGDLFGVDDEDYINFFARYSSYFGVNYSYTEMTISDDDSKWGNSLSIPAKFSESEFTPILLSNHLHDFVYMHWTAFGLYKIYQLKSFLNTIKKPLLIFSYQPKSWQLEIIRFHFPSLHVTYTVTDRPTVFPSLYIVAHKQSALFDSSFLSSLYRKSAMQMSCVNRRKLFLTRNDGNQRRIINQRNINTLLVSNGYTVVTLTEYTYETQISMIASASSLIFIVGSDLLATLHAPVDCKVGMITAPTLDNSCSGFCANFGHLQVIPFFTDLVQEDQQINFHIDENSFQAFLKILEDK